MKKCRSIKPWSNVREDIEDEREGERRGGEEGGREGRRERKRKRDRSHVSAKMDLSYTPTPTFSYTHKKVPFCFILTCLYKMKEVKKHFFFPNETFNCQWFLTR